MIRHVRKDIFFKIPRTPADVINGATLPVVGNVVTLTIQVAQNRLSIRVEISTVP